jgi:PTS system nitrogen regulatory IIA component
MGIIERIKHMITAQSPEAETKDEGGATKVLHVSDYLTEKNVLFFPARMDKSYILRDLVQSMDLNDPETALKEVLYRELWGRTVIAPGLAIPHARIPSMPRISAALGICQQGVADPKTKSDRSSIFLLFIGPTNDVQQHLAFLAASSRLFQKRNLPELLLQSTTPESAYAQLRRAEAA